MSSNPFDKIDKHLVSGDAANVLAIRAVYNFGVEGQPPLFYRFAVLEVIFDPTAVDEKRRDYYAHTLGVSNIKLAQILPRNTIVARRVLEGTASSSEPAMFLFPFFPPAISMPIAPGEHVWAMFEHPSGKQNDLGYYFCRIVEVGFVEDVNHTHAPRALDPSFSPGSKDTAEGSDDAIYEFRNGSPGTRDGERYSIAETLSIQPPSADAYEKLMTDSEAGKLMTYEAVPRYRKRPGELAFEGTNNTLIVLGRDRTGAVAKYKSDPDKGAQVVDGIPDDDVTLSEKQAGAIDIVVGRGQTDKTSGKIVKSKKVDKSDFNEEVGKSKKELVENEGDPDFKNDRARVLISQRIPVDKHFKIDKVVAAHNSNGVEIPKDVDSGDGSVVIKADKVRLIARQDLIIMVTGAKDSDRDDKGRIKDTDPDPDKCATVTIRASGDIIFTPAKTGLIRLGGDDATLSPLCTRVGNAPGMSGPVPKPSPIIDTMGGAQGTADGLNGTFATRVLLK